MHYKVKRAQHNANNTPDILYIIYIKSNQCWYCVHSMAHVLLMGLSLPPFDGLVCKGFVLINTNNNDFVTFIRFHIMLHSNRKNHMLCA